MPLSITPTQNNVRGVSYLSWNDAICRHLFEEQDHKEVLLYLSKPEIVGIGRRFDGNHANDDQSIWSDFRAKAISGLPVGGANNLVDRIIGAHRTWQPQPLFGNRRTLQVGQNTITLKYPPYVCLLLSTVIPLVEGDVDLNANNYYDRVNQYWGFVGDRQLNSTLFSKLEPVWRDLQNWTESNGRSKLLLPAINGNRRHVGRPLSQCPLRPVQLNKLPSLFEVAGLLPRSKNDMPYEQSEFEEAFNEHAESTLKITSQRKAELLGETYRMPLLSQMQQLHERWDGEQDDDEEIVDAGTHSRTPKVSKSLAKLVPQIKESGRNSFEISYRVNHPKQDLPEDLVLDQGTGIPIRAHIAGWSKTLPLDFLAADRDLRSTDRKWRFRPEPVHYGILLFTRGTHYGLSNDYWLQTPCLQSHFKSVMILCDERFSAEMTANWQSQSGRIETIDGDGIPHGYILFRITAPFTSHPDECYKALQFPGSDAFSISLVGGIAIKSHDAIRCFLDHPLPQVQLGGGNGTERLMLKYERSDHQLELHKETIDDKDDITGNRWLLPFDITLNERFRIECAQLGIRSDSFEIRDTVGASNRVAKQLDEGGLRLPRRGPNGTPADPQSNEWMEGCHVEGPATWNHKEVYGHLFIPRNQGSGDTPASQERYDDRIRPGNILLAFLSMKAHGTYHGTFREAFDVLRDSAMRDREEGQVPDTPKWVTLYYLEQLGHIEVEVDVRGETRFTVNRPALILKPTSLGVHALLTGSRDKELMDSLIERASALNIAIKVVPQYEDNSHLILPDAIEFHALGQDGIARLRRLVDDLPVRFESGHLVPPRIIELCTDHVSLSNSLACVNDQVEHIRCRHVFDPATLRWNLNIDPNLDKKFLLAEYRLRNYARLYWLWKDGVAYSVDKNWGRYLALRHASANVIKVVDQGEWKDGLVPVAAPLPRLIARAFALMTGVAPRQMDLEGRRYLFYSKLPSILFQNTAGRNCGQQV